MRSQTGQAFLEYPPLSLEQYTPPEGRWAIGYVGFGLAWIAEWGSRDGRKSWVIWQRTAAELAATLAAAEADPFMSESDDSTVLTPSSAGSART